MTISIKKCKEIKALKIRKDKDKEKEEDVIWNPNYSRIISGLYVLSDRISYENVGKKRRSSKLSTGSI